MIAKQLRLLKAPKLRLISSTVEGVKWVHIKVRHTGQKS
jgi:hypothetical protein